MPETRSDTSTTWFVARHQPDCLDPARPHGRPHLRAQDGGRPLQLSSMGGQIAFPAFSMYHAAGWPVENTEDHLVGLRSPHGTGPYLEFLRVPDGKRAKNRLHPDVAPYRGGDPGAEIARLQKEGATLADVGQGGDVSWTVLADPESNDFCVLSPR